MDTHMQTSTEDPDQDEWQIPAYQEPLRTWAGSGTGGPCSFCGRSIKAHEIEYEIELAPPATERSLQFHSHCHRAWEAQGRHGDQARPGT
jgi:hypothetical protein